MSDNNTINYARVDGIDKSEVSAAIIFTAVYFPLLFFAIFRAVRRPTFVFIVLCLFCIARLIAFAMRAVLAGSNTAGQKINVVVAEAVIYSVGFSGLLYSAYTLILDRDLLTSFRGVQHGGVLGALRGIITNRHIFRAAVSAAIIMGIVGGVKQSDLNNQSAQDLGNTLRKASVFVFLGVVGCLCIISVMLVYDERAAGVWSYKETSFGKQYGIFVILLVSLLCMIRELYLSVTIGNTAKQNRASRWYPLVATPELLCVFLFMTPGLVPSRQEIAEGKEGRVQVTTGLPSDIPLRSQYAV